MGIASAFAQMPAWVTDTAHEAAQIAFGLNDLHTARWATDIGHLLGGIVIMSPLVLQVAAAAARRGRPAG